MTSSYDVSYNTLGDGPYSITGTYVSYASIIGNTGVEYDGINLDHLSGLLISQNNIQAHTPIFVYSCGDLTINNNTVNSPDTGIGVSNCNNVLISNNNANVGRTASNGGVVGIWVDGSDSINITSNTVSYNIGGGIRLTNFATGNASTNHLISNNQSGTQTDSSPHLDQNYLANNTFAAHTQA